MLEAKPWYESRTIWLMLAMVFLSAISAQDIVKVIPLSWMPYITAIGALVGILVRFATNQPVSPPGG